MRRGEEPDDASSLGEFFGGPDDGRPVVLEPGWPRPDVIGHRDWPGDGYVWNYDQGRFEWKTNAMKEIAVTEKVEGDEPGRSVDRVANAIMSYGAIAALVGVFCYGLVLSAREIVRVLTQ